MADGKGQAAAQKRNDVSRHEAFVELHNLSRTHNEEFLVPEIALVGGDLHTRVGMLQAVLGVRLTISEFEEKLRVPLVIQSLLNPACRTPDVRVFNPSAQSFTSALSLTFESALADAVLSAQMQIKDTSPLIIKCQSATSPNLQIFLPPQVLVTDAATAADGEELESVVTMLPAKKVSRQLTPRHRLIAVVTTPKDTPADNVGLQAALKADRQLTRTVVLTALRPSDVKALQADSPKSKKLELLAADFQAALHPGFPPPPVAAVVLPAAASASAWKQALTSAEESAVAAAKSLVGAGAAPPTSGAAAAGKLLEAEVASRQQAATQGLLSTLQMRSESARGRAQDAEAAMSAMLDAGQLRASHMRTVTDLLDCFTALLGGNGTIDMAEHGLTSAEECARLSDDPWPMVDTCGGGAGGEEGDAEAVMVPVGSERCLEEFDELLECEAEFGSATWHASRRLFDVHRIANMLLASDEAGAPRGHAMSSRVVAPQDSIFPHASPDAQRRVGHAMGRTAAEQLLQPLARALCDRLSSALGRLPALALAEQEARTAAGLGLGGSLLPPQLADSFRNALEVQVKELVASVLEHLRQQISTVIKHTGVPAPWPLAIESPLFDAPGRAGSVSSISSRHYRMNPSGGGMPVAQAIGEGFESRDSSISGLVAAMGRDRAPTDEEESDEEEEESEDEEEAVAAATPSRGPPVAPAAPPPPVPQMHEVDEEESEEEEEDDAEEEEEEILTTVSMEHAAVPAPAAHVHAPPPVPARVPSSKGRAPVQEDSEEEEVAVPVAAVVRRPSVSAPGGTADAQPGPPETGTRSKKKGAKAAAAAAQVQATAQPIVVEEVVVAGDPSRAGKVPEKRRKSKKGVEHAPVEDAAVYKAAAVPPPPPSPPQESTGGLPVQPAGSVEAAAEGTARKKKKKKKAAAAHSESAAEAPAEGAGPAEAAVVGRQRSIKANRSVTVRSGDGGAVDGGGEADELAGGEEAAAAQGPSGRGERQGGLQRSESAVLESAAARHPVYLGVMAHVEAMFSEIKAGVIAYGLANCVRATLLQPISSLSLKQTVMLHLFSGSDDDIMAKYGSQETLHMARCALEKAQDHHSALMRCRRQFEGIVTAEGGGTSGGGSIWGGIDLGAGGFNANYY